jgi:hypothetical protein
MTAETPTTPVISLNGESAPATAPQPTNPSSSETDATQAPTRIALKRSAPSTASKFSVQSVPPPGSVLTGKQEHCKTRLDTSYATMADFGFKDLKRELLSEQVKSEIAELASPTALQRFGAPFRSDAGEVAPEDSELPILRYIFVHHVRNFPFLDKAKEKEFWQDKLQVVRWSSSQESSRALC